MRAAILTIGQEILIGQVVDTNSAWIASRLNEIGIEIHEILSIPDLSERIISSVRQLNNEYDLVLVTGGLGPTSDDITKPALCKAFNCGSILHEPTLEHIKNIFTSRGLPLTDLNSKQAEVPDCCEVLPNPLGTAPGMWFNADKSILVSMPGVPFEMKGIMENYVLPRLKSASGNRVIIHKTIHTFGLPESFLAEKLSEWEKELPQSISIAYLPSPLSIRLRISSTGYNNDEIDSLIQLQIDKLYKIIPENIFGFGDDTMALVVGKLLKSKKSTLAVAESCTGGTISEMITANSGSSEYFLGGVVAYSNELKKRLLGVDGNHLTTYGAVSQQVVESMAIGIRKVTGADYAIATSGIAGPTGGTPQKPVGTIWIAVSSGSNTVSKMYKFSNDRERNITRSSVTALNMLRLLLLKEIYKK